VRALLRSPPPQVFIEYVMLARRQRRYAQAVQLAELLDPKIYKVNLIPYNPTDSLRRLLARRDRRVQGRARGARPARDGPAHPRPRHRRRVRPAGRDQHGPGVLSRASPARSRRSRSAASSSGLGSHCAISGRSSSERSPNSFRNSGVVR
jgi:hypothetical protein